jgi:hypothetical protein
MSLENLKCSINYDDPVCAHISLTADLRYEEAQRLAAAIRRRGTVELAGYALVASLAEYASGIVADHIQPPHPIPSAPDPAARDAPSSHKQDQA